MALVSDFFYPGFGGVECHIYNVAMCLLRRGHKVIIISRAYGDRCGIRYTTFGLKVYHLPMAYATFPPGVVTLPGIFSALPIVRDIIIREQIEIVHGHQTTSNLCHEAMMHATVLGVKTVFTDHSLFGFADGASIHINKVLDWWLRCVDEVICVSHTSRENTVLRARIPPQRCSVIPNGTDTSAFQPPIHTKYRTWANSIADADGIITIVVITRIVYRKGADLFADVIPEVCRKHPNVRWVIGGDGPRKAQLDAMIENNNLYDRVKMLGALRHTEVQGVLNQGQIFLNCSLTEAFCIAIIEAASCGLLCVSTGVGGVPEVLPPELLLLAEPEPSSILDAIDRAIEQVPSVSPWDVHAKVKQYYCWDAVAERTEKIYDLVTRQRNRSHRECFLEYLACGPIYGMLLICFFAINLVYSMILEWLRPAYNVDIVPFIPFSAFKKHGHKIFQ